MLQSAYIGFVQPETAVGVGAIRGEIATDVEKLVLYDAQHLLGLAGYVMQIVEQADKRIEFVDGAVCLKAHIVFRHTLSTRQRRLSAVAGCRINITFLYHKRYILRVLM